MITRYASIPIIMFLLAFSLALVLGNILLLNLGLASLFVGLLGLFIPGPSQPGITRNIAKSTLWVDQKTTINWEVEVGGGIGPVLIYDHLPVEIEVTSGSNYRAFWKGLGRVRLTNSYEIRCPKRGSYELPASRWEVRHPMEFRHPAEGSAQDPVSFTVLPRVLAARRIRNVRGRATTPYPAVDLARLGVATTDFKEIREYVPGDPIRFINWKATARRGTSNSATPLVNQFELEGKKAIWLFFDSSYHMNVGTTLRSPLEHAIEAAGALGHYYLSRGYYLGAHFSHRPDAMLYPETGKGQLHRLSRELLLLRPLDRHYDMLRAVQVCRVHLLRYSPRCVVITRLDAEVPEMSGASRPLNQPLLNGIDRLIGLSARGRRRMTFWVVAINGYHYSGEGTQTNEMAQTLRSMETLPTVRALRAKGVSVLEWNPFAEEFAQTLLRQLRLEGTRE